MKTVDINDASASLSEYARNLASEPLVVTDAGRTIAALIPIEDDDVDAMRLASHQQFVAILEKARAQRIAGKTLSSDDVRRELGLSR